MFMVKVVEVLDSVKLDPIKEEVFFFKGFIYKHGRIYKNVDTI